MTTAVTSANATTTNTAAQTGADPTAALSQDYTTFIKLLTTQLQNQDPLSPMDSSQFTQQLVQFSSVEQQMQANTKLQSLISLQNASANQQALNYLGKIGEISGESVPLVNGAGAFSYSLSTVADQNTIQIMNSDGTVVRTVQGSETTGKHVVTWDGTADDGTQMPDGLYTFKVSPTRTDGTAVTSKDTTYGLINSISTNTDGTVELSMTYLQGKPSDILSINTSLSGVSNAIQTTSASTSTGSSGT